MQFTIHIFLKKILVYILVEGGARVALHFRCMDTYVELCVFLLLEIVRFRMSCLQLDFSFVHSFTDPHSVPLNSLGS